MLHAWLQNLGCADKVLCVQQALSITAIALAACYGSIITSMWTAACYYRAVKHPTFHGVAAVTLLVEQGPWPAVLANGFAFAAHLQEADHVPHRKKPTKHRPAVIPTPDIPTVINFV